MKGIIEKRNKEERMKNGRGVRSGIWTLVRPPTVRRIKRWEKLFERSQEPEFRREFNE